MQKGGQELSQGMDDAMGHVLCSGTQMEDRKNLRAGGRWPATARARVESSAAWFAVHPIGDGGAADGRRIARARSVHV